MVKSCRNTQNWCGNFIVTMRKPCVTLSNQFKQLLWTAMFWQLMLVSCGKQRKM
ncbi:hypothetical protein OIU79_004051 [Salix purpurea]|uniref:Uncharacterized protein n=1 Tax=Salix purpurea TaxID=77065 RepID=A0A9Q0Z927_SALPP|nr:hypothetical protein OIU79_004051 [Salix purpurea]